MFIELKVLFWCRSTVLLAMLKKYEHELMLDHNPMTTETERASHH